MTGAARACWGWLRCGHSRIHGALEHQPPARIDRHQLAVTECGGSADRAHDARNSQLTRDDCSVTGHPTGVGDDRGGAAHQRHPVGRRHVRDQHLPGLKPFRVPERRQNPATPRRLSGGGPETVQKRSTYARRRVAGSNIAGFRSSRDRPGLQDPQLAVGIERPLGVLCRAVVLLDREAQPRQRDHLRVVKHRAHRLLAGELSCLRAAAGPRLDHESLRPHLAGQHRKGVLVHNVSIG